MFGLLGRKLRGDLRAQRTQFAAIIVTLLVGVALFGASYDSYRNLQASYDRVFTELTFANRWFIGLDSSAATTLSQEAGVDAVTARTVAEVPLRFGGDHVLLGRAVSMPAGEQPAVNQVHLLEGSYLGASGNGLILESHAASHFGLGPGDAVEVLTGSGWRSVPIVGVAISPEYIWPARSRQDVLTSSDDFAVVFAPESLVGELAASETHPEVTVHYAADAPPAATDARVEAAGRSLGAADTYDRVEQPSNAALSEDIQGFGEMAVMFPLLFVVATVMGTYIVLSRLVRQQRPLIGTLLATGFGRRAVFRHYLGYGLVPAAVAAVLGTAFGALLARWVTNLYTDTIGLPFRVHGVHAVTIVAGVGLALLAGVIAAGPPALAAIRLSPAEAMRGAVPSGRGGTSLVERITPGLSRVPVRWRLVLRNIGRQRRRTAYSAAGIVLALVLVLVSWGMLDTTQILVNRQFNEIQRWDARVYLDTPADAAELQRLEAVDGVATAERVTTLGVVVASGDRSYSTQLTGYQPDTQMHRFLSTNGDWVPLPAEGILAGEAIESLLGVGVGDEVLVQVPGSSMGARVPIAGFVNEPLGTMVYASESQVAAIESGNVQASVTGSFQTIQTQTSGAEVSTAEVIYDDGVDRATVRDALMGTPSVVAVTDARALLDTLNQFLGLFYGFVGIMLLFGGLLAGALIFTSMSANVAERSAELAGLRAAGMGQGTLSRLVSVENAITALLGVPPGLIVGYFVSKAFMGSFSSDLFQFNLEMRWTTPLFAAIGVMVLAVLAQIPALRGLRRIDLGGVLRTRAF